MGADFELFWQVGQAILNGIDPYSVGNSFYPPPSAFAFVLLALLPGPVAYPAWSVLNILLMADVLRRRGLSVAWFLFTPVLFVLMTGQLDIFFFWIAVQIHPSRWTSIPLALVLTLKPQVAAMVLPALLIEWFREKKVYLGIWAGLLVVLYTLPLLFDNQIYQNWYGAVAGYSGERVRMSGGIFTLTALGVPEWVLWGSAIALGLWGVFQPQGASRAAILAALPVGMWYENVFFVGTGPAWVLIVWSWVAFAMAALLSSAIPLATLALVALALNLQNRSTRERVLIFVNARGCGR